MHTPSHPHTCIWAVGRSCHKDLWGSVSSKFGCPPTPYPGVGTRLMARRAPLGHLSSPIARAWQLELRDAPQAPPVHTCALHRLAFRHHPRLCGKPSFPLVLSIRLKAGHVPHVRPIPRQTGPEALGSGTCPGISLQGERLSAVCRKLGTRKQATAEGAVPLPPEFTHSSLRVCQAQSYLGAQGSGSQQTAPQLGLGFHPQEQDEGFSGPRPRQRHLPGALGPEGAGRQLKRPSWVSLFKF